MITATALFCHHAVLCIFFTLEIVLYHVDRQPIDIIDTYTHHRIRVDIFDDALTCPGRLD